MMLSTNINTILFGVTKHLFTIVGVVSVFFVSSKLVKQQRLFDVLCKLGASSFFIYAIHRIAIIYTVNNVVCAWLSVDSQWMMIAAYFIVATSTVLVCLIIYRFIAWLSPQTLSILVGGR